MRDQVVVVGGPCGFGYLEVRSATRNVSVDQVGESFFLPLKLKTR